MDSNEHERLREQRYRLKETYGALFDEISALLYRHDPIGINQMVDAEDRAPENEYDPEAGTIIPRIASVSSPEDVLEVVYEEFERWFGSRTAGPKENYRQVAQDLWKLRNDNRAWPAS